MSAFCRTVLCKNSLLISLLFKGAASFTIYTGTKDALHERGLFADARISHAAISGALGGVTSGSLLTFGTTRERRL